MSVKILQICSKPPFPPQDGGSIAMNALTQGLIKCGNSVHVLTISTAKHLVDEKKIDIDYLQKTNFYSVFIDTSIKPLHAFFNLFSNKSYNVIRFYSKEFEKKIIEQLSSNTYDIILLESLWVVCYINTLRLHSKAKIIFRSHNIEYLIWERLRAECINPFKKWYLNLLAKRLKKYEYKVLNLFDGIASITEYDVRHYKKMGLTTPIITIPFGIDTEKFVEDKSIKEIALFHIGAMDWLPNAEAIKWFLKLVWNEIYKKHTTTKLYLAGRNMPAWLKELQQNNVEIVGEVSDSHKFMNSKSIMVVPLSSGGGMRVKIIEGMALGKTIISTTIGAEGIACENEKNIIIANTPSEFIQAIERCLTDKKYCDNIGENARKLVEEKYDNFVISSQLSDFFKLLLK